MPRPRHVSRWRLERFAPNAGSPHVRDIILVVGDAGGPIGLGVAARHPEWFAGLVLAGTFGWSLKEYPKVSRMLRIVSSPLFGLLQEHSNWYSCIGVGWPDSARGTPTACPRQATMLNSESWR
jgi:pimeloyl-ACP methyl ester carboxylesterase